jgi:hypothetical protein
MLKLFVIRITLGLFWFAFTIVKNIYICAGRCRGTRRKVKRRRVSVAAAGPAEPGAINPLFKHRM